MLIPKLNNCKDCASIDLLLEEIECVLRKMSNVLYNNISYMLNTPFKYTDALDLLMYRRILLYKAVNPDYACKFSINDIASKIKLQTAGCVQECFPYPSTTTTTTTSNFAPQILYGLLYNSYAAYSPLKITSSDDWRIPSRVYDYINVLATFLGGTAVAGGELKETGITYWDTPNVGATNSSNFNAKGAGFRIGEDFYYIKEELHLGTDLWDLQAVVSNYDALFVGASGFGDNAGLSLRLLKTSTTLTNGQSGTYIGNDGTSYRTICIGTQEWLADNLCETKFRDGSLIPEITDGLVWGSMTTPGLCAYDNDWANVYTII